MASRDYHVRYHTRRGWRIWFNDIEICGAVSRSVAEQTALLLSELRKWNP